MHVRRPTPEIANLFETKAHRLQLTESLQDFFAINPKYHNNRESGFDSPSTKTVRFVIDSDSLNDMIIFHDLSASARSLTSIPEESIGLDHTQHARLPTTEVSCTELDTTGHHRRDMMDGKM